MHDPGHRWPALPRTQGLRAPTPPQTTTAGTKTLIGSDMASMRKEDHDGYATEHELLAKEVRHAHSAAP